VNGHDEDWQFNYLNYFTEVEEHFQRARGTGLFLLSPLDWALVESWKNAEVPLEAVLRGIDVAFEKWRSRRSKIHMVNSLAYCAQAVMSEAQHMAGTARRQQGMVPAPFELDDLKHHLARCAVQLRSQSGAGYEEIAASLDRLAERADSDYENLEDLERKLTTIEEKMIAIARAARSEEELVEFRRELDAELRPYRSKMTAGQLSMLEKQYLERRLLEAAGLPRLSLFYLR